MTAFYADPKPLPCLSLSGARKALFIGIGGGGDVASATVLAKAFERCGGEATVASFVWERISVDPYPGPIPLNQLEPRNELGDGVAWVYRTTVAKRPTGVVKPQISRVAEVLGKVLALDLWLGPQRLAKSLRKLVDEMGIDIVVGVDVGGDSLARGCEEELWSPLADAVGVAMLSELGNALLAVIAPGADGELSPSYVASRVLELSSRGGLLGGYIFGIEDRRVFEEIISRVHTEASSIPLRALKGFTGIAEIRGGTRIVEVGPLSISVFLLDPSKVVEHCVAKIVRNAQSLEDANEAMHSHGIYTELDLERDAYEVIRSGLSIEPRTLIEIRKRGREKLGFCREP